MIQSIEQMIDQYILAWNANQPEQYESAFAACWDLSANYSDPNFPSIEGLHGLVDFAKDALAKMGARTFSIVPSNDTSVFSSNILLWSKEYLKNTLPVIWVSLQYF